MAIDRTREFRRLQTALRQQEKASLGPPSAPARARNPEDGAVCICREGDFNTRQVLDELLKLRKFMLRHGKDAE